MTTSRPHLLHVAADGRAHLHWAKGCSDREIGRAGRAARVLLGLERRAPSGLAAGFYDLGVRPDGVAHLGPRLKTMEDYA
jgi:hypothetical protein